MFECVSLLLSLSFMTNYSVIVSSILALSAACSFSHCLVISWQPIPLPLLMDMADGQLSWQSPHP